VRGLHIACNVVVVDIATLVAIVGKVGHLCDVLLVLVLVLVLLLLLRRRRRIQKGPTVV